MKIPSRIFFVRCHRSWKADKYTGLFYAFWPATFRNVSGRKKRQAAQGVQAAIEARQQNSRRRMLVFAALVLCAGSIAAVLLVEYHASSPKTAGSSVPSLTPIPALPSLEQLISMPPEHLAKVDIAVINLRCAEGLIGSEKFNIEEAISTLDMWAARVKYQTEKYWYKFNYRPQDFENSEAYYRMIVLATVLQEDFGLRYDPALKVGFPPPEDDRFFDDSRNVMINGIIERQLGSCASLPVVYVAVGRRLGYPLKLVPTNSHLYLRWEDSRSRFNIEATAEGFVSHKDQEYWRWPQPVTPQQAEKYEYFKPFSPSDELACFLSARGEVLMANDDYENSLKFHQLAEKVSPHSELYKLILKKVRPYVDYRRKFDEEVRKRQVIAEEQASLDDITRINAINQRNGASSPSLQVPVPRIPQEPVPRVRYEAPRPGGNKFTPILQGNTKLRPQSPYGSQPSTRSVPGATPRVR